MSRATILFIMSHSVKSNNLFQTLQNLNTISRKLGVFEILPRKLYTTIKFFLYKYKHASAQIGTFTVE